ncbi:MULTISPECIES: hypothetical protein [Curtobacterium]|uniref:hypothetical protein n=1 Tax=Curtobacterium TaxID=2034 RepID=UPI000DA770E4|nr:MULTISPECIES: hypothetical protein [Curtobacterium]MBT1598190.1 hypothetical protein [Curtobacterium flaccumfaciens pv. flaccumfaciens]MCS0472354.1 hypothetical protein [Curtobacterium flaccumfaciens pv. betae]MCS0473850.1 hypothetical protein [Curtobacterium flaccumfaciens pv. betae]MCS0479094.1 hypothetical protein [Curtobacterium flaccumfaciens pv. betae]MCS0480815.1 hypothetical protein [Curtobacterium flaccumfaciens pv. betae]
MKKNATIALVLLAVAIPVLVGCAIQASALFDLVDRTGADGSVMTFTFILAIAAFVALATGISFGLTALVQRAERRHVVSAH